MNNINRFCIRLIAILIKHFVPLLETVALTSILALFLKAGVLVITKPGLTSFEAQQGMWMFFKHGIPLVALAAAMVYIHRQRKKEPRRAGFFFP